MRRFGNGGESTGSRVRNLPKEGVVGKRKIVVRHGDVLDVSFDLVRLGFLQDSHLLSFGLDLIYCRGNSSIGLSVVSPFRRISAPPICLDTEGGDGSRVDRPRITPSGPVGVTRLLTPSLYNSLHGLQCVESFSISTLSFRLD